MRKIFVSSVFAFLFASSAAPGQTIVELTGIDGQIVTLSEFTFDAGWSLRGKKSGGTFTLPAPDAVAIRIPRKSAPVFAKGEQAVFATDERLVGKIAGYDNEKIKYQTNVVGTVEFPLTALRGLITDDGFVGDPVAFLSAPTTAGGDVVILKNKDVLVGVLAGINDNKFRLDQKGKETSLDHDLIAGVRFDPSLTDYKRNDSFFVRARFVDGAVLDFKSLVTKEKKIVGALHFASGDVLFDLADVAEFQFRNGRVVYLSDLPIAKTRVEPFVDAKRTPRLDKSVLGSPLTSGGKFFSKGIGVQSFTSLTYQLTSDYERFEAAIALDDLANSQASVRFLVKVDGRLAYESPEVLAGASPLPIKVAIKGAKELELIVDFAKRGDVQDFANWLNASLVR